MSWSPWAGEQGVARIGDYTAGFILSTGKQWSILLTIRHDDRRHIIFPSSA